MNNLTKDFIAIDTNIFEHLLTKEDQENKNNHIDQLLKQLLIIDKIKLLVDSKKRITNEYYNRLTKRVKQINDDSKKRRLLRYWVKLENRKCVTVSRDALIKKIKKIIPLGDGPVTDCYFVYVAFKEGRILITNDESDMVNKGNIIGERRDELLDISKNSGRKKGSDILTSWDAYK